MQRALWASQLNQSDAPVQNMPLLSHLRGPVDPDRLAAAFETIVRQSDALRTRIIGRDPQTGRWTIQLMEADVIPATEIVDIEHDEVLEWAIARSSTPLDMAHSGFDSAIARHADGTVSWYLNLHHVVTDATSSALVFEATAQRYHADDASAGSETEPASYYGWSRRLAAKLESQTDKASRRSIEYWRDRQPAPRIGQLYKTVETPTADASRWPLGVDADLMRQATDRLDTDYRMLTPDLGWSALLLTTTALYSHRLTGADRFSIGLPVHNRSQRDAKELIGPTMEVFPVDITIDRGDTFRSLHARISKSMLQTLKHAAPGTAPAPDFDAVVNVIPRPVQLQFGTVPVETRWLHCGAIEPSNLLRVQMTGYTSEFGDADDTSSTFALELNHGAAEPKQRERAGQHFTTILNEMLTAPDDAIAGRSVCTDAELTEWSAWETGPAVKGNAPLVLERLQQALATSSTPALGSAESDTAQHVSGADLWQWAGATASWLADSGVQPGDRVAVELPRSVESVVAILAVMASGASFVPIDPTQPERRRTRLIERAQCVMTLSSTADVAATRPKAPESTTFTPIDRNADDEAYLLFTSGSTGEPKGVPITHGGLAGYLRFASESYPATDQNGNPTAPTAPLFSALTFDLTITSLFVPMLVGGTLLVVADDGPRGLQTIASTPQINWCKATPSHLELLIRLLPAHHGLRTLIVGGEAFSARLATDLLTAEPDLRIFNEYGPTEAVVGCMIHEVEAAELHRQSEVPIGTPSPGVELRVVDDAGHRVALGATGELCISHDGVTTGYLGTDTTEAVDGPFVTIDGARYYRSGDLVRLNERSEAVYLGRKDAQVKVGGIRLDPIEVEEALNSHPEIERSSVRLWSPSATVPTKHCVRCGLPDNVPGVEFDEAQICDTCHAYERVAPITQSWFRTPEDLQAKLAEVRKRRTGPYDCLHLLSGGKDSTFALYKLVELGFHPYVLTLDNGFIAEGAKENVRRSVAELGLDHEFATSESMNAIFRDSLDRYSNVCHGCYKTIYTLATNRAAAIGAPLIVTGLSRGQLFETRLIPQQFSEDRFDPEAIDRAVLEARKIYHRVDDPTNRLLDNDVFADDEVFEQIEYLDFYRYVDVELADMLSFLDESAPWVRPPDSGRSTNCLVNAAGIHTHQTEQGYHNYAVPYAWDVRLGHKTRQEAIEELDDGLDLDDVGNMLDEIGYRPNPRQVLTAWIDPTAGADEIPGPSELRGFLADLLPTHAIPAAFVQVDGLPLTTNGKLDEAALPAPKRMHRPGPTLQLSATTEMERSVIDTWERILRLEPIGPDDDFFALGGDSLAALEMIVALGDALKANVPEDLAFANTTVRDLAAAIDNAIGTDQISLDNAITDLERFGTPPGDQPRLSAGELAVLFDQSNRPSDVMYNVGRVYHLQLELDAEKFEAALRVVSQHHQPLSWSYGSPRTKLSPSNAVEFYAASDAASQQDLDERIDDLHRKPFDLDNGPLLRCLVQPMDDETTIVVFVIHHASGDASSFPVLWRQVEQVMAGDTNLAPADYAAFNAWQASQHSTDDRAHWLDASGSTDPGALAVHLPSGPEPDGFLTRAASASPASLRSGAGTSAAARALAAVAATVAEYSDSSEVEIGLITSTRAGAASDSLFGYFLNTVPVRVACEEGGAPASLELLADRAAAAIGGAVSHRAYPLAQIVADRQAEGRPRPSLDVLMAFDELQDVSVLGSPAHQRVLSNGTAVAPLTFFVEVRENRIDLSVEYQGSVVSNETAERMLETLDQRLAESSGTASPSLDAASMLIGADLDDRSLVLTQIAGHLASGSTGAAVVCGDTELSWSDLARRVSTVAAVLVASGVERGDLVAVCVPRSVDLIAAILGVQLVGAAYVPIDPSYPDDRIEVITTGANATVGIVDGAHVSLVNRPLVLTSEGIDGRSFAAEPGTPTAGDLIDTSHVDPNSTAYAIFTSGSTGQPRGVPVTHRMLAASTNARADFYPVAPTRFLVPSSPAFDSSVVGLFWTLAHGGTVVMPTEDEAHDVLAIHRLATSSVSHTLMVPTLYQALLSLPTDDTAWPDHVIVAGEACPPALVEAHFATHPDAALTNEYGPTEATVWATAHHCSPEDVVVPIGPPIPGTWVAVVDDLDRIRPADVEGNLIIGGLGVVSGYLNDVEATAAKFAALAPSTRSSGTTPSAGDRFFRTGDRAVVSNGQLRFLGRGDSQLNIGGTRAEPEDIEDALLVVNGVNAVIAVAADVRPIGELLDSLPNRVVGAAMEASWNTPDPAAALVTSLRTEGSRQLQLVVHVEAPDRADDPALSDELRAAAKASLPPLLRPARYEVHQDLPRTPNGKLDRSAAAELPLSSTPQTAGPSTSISSAQGSGENQQLVSTLTGLFASALNSNSFGADDSFFDHGGHSLLAMELLLAIEDSLGQRIPASSLYSSPTPREFAAEMNGSNTKRTTSFLVPIQPKGSKPPIFAVHVLGLDCLFFRPLAARLGDDQPMFGLGQPTKDLDTGGPTAVEAVAEVYATEIQRAAPTGPISLAAISLGGVVAYELAQQLIALGRDVSLLALFDSLGPDAAGATGPSRKHRIGAHLDRFGTDPKRYMSEQADRQGRKLTRTRERAKLARQRRTNAPVDHQLGVRQFIEENVSSQLNYRFNAYPGRMLVIKAEDDPFTEFYVEANMGWQRLAAGGLEVGIAPGGHLSMMEEPNVEVLAEVLSSALDRSAEARATTIDRATIDGATIDGATIERILIDGLRNGQLPSVMSRLSKQPGLGADAVRTISEGQQLFGALASTMTTEAASVGAALEAGGISASVVPVPRQLQHGSASIEVEGDPWTATQILATLGYLPVDSSSHAALIAAVKARGWIDYIRRGETTSRIRLRWSNVSDRGRSKLSRVTDRMAPTSKDFEVADLPPWAWPAYWPVRPIRLAAERLQAGLHGAGIVESAGTADLGIFLGTPTGLIEPLLRFAGVDEDDLVIDIGCGDGRVLIGAAQSFGCRARGYEIDPELVRQARDAVASAGLDDRIEIIEGDATEASHVDADVVFAFLPPEAVSAILEPTLNQLPAGAVFLSHEQLASKVPTPPDRSKLIIGLPSERPETGGITVANLWKGRRQG